MITIHHTTHCTMTARVILCADDETIRHSGLDAEGCEPDDISAAVMAGLTAFGDQMHAYWGEIEDERDSFFANWNGGRRRMADWRGRWYAAYIAQEERDEDEDGEPLEPLGRLDADAERREFHLAQVRCNALLDLCDAAATRAAQSVLNDARRANEAWLAEAAAQEG